MKQIKAVLAVLFCIMQPIQIKTRENRQLKEKLKAFMLSITYSIFSLPGMLSDPLCSRHAGGISAAVTSCRLFLETGINVERFIGRGLFE